MGTTDGLATDVLFRVLNSVPTGTGNQGTDGVGAGTCTGVAQVYVSASPSASVASTSSCSGLKVPVAGAYTAAVTEPAAGRTTTGGALHTAATLRLPATEVQPSDTTACHVHVATLSGVMVGASALLLLSTAAGVPVKPAATPGVPSGVAATLTTLQLAASGSPSLSYTRLALVSVTVGKAVPVHTDCSGTVGRSNTGGLLQAAVKLIHTGTTLPPSVTVACTTYTPATGADAATVGAVTVGAPSTAAEVTPAGAVVTSHVTRSMVVPMSPAACPAASILALAFSVIGPNTPAAPFQGADPEEDGVTIKMGVRGQAATTSVSADASRQPSDTVSRRRRRPSLVAVYTGAPALRSDSTCTTDTADSVPVTAAARNSDGGVGRKAGPTMDHIYAGAAAADEVVPSRVLGGKPVPSHTTVTTPSTPAHDASRSEAFMPAGSDTVLAYDASSVGVAGTPAVPVAAATGATAHPTARSMVVVTTLQPSCAVSVTVCVPDTVGDTATANPPLPATTTTPALPVLPNGSVTTHVAPPSATPPVAFARTTTVCHALPFHDDPAAGVTPSALAKRASVTAGGGAHRAATVINSYTTLQPSDTRSAKVRMPTTPAR